MEKGIDTAGLMKSLEEGKSKLVFSNTSSISDYDVEGYERRFYGNLNLYSSISRECCSLHIGRIPESV